MLGIPGGDHFCYSMDTRALSIVLKEILSLLRISCSSYTAVAANTEKNAVASLKIFKGLNTCMREPKSNLGVQFRTTRLIHHLNLGVT